MSEHKKADVILAARDQLFHEAIETQGCISVSYRWPCSDGRIAQLKLELIEGEKKNVTQAPQTPCGLCMYNPPSSRDGKPCSVCPASAVYRDGEAEP